MGRERTAILIACVAGTVCLFGILTFLSLRNQSSRPSANAPATTSTPSKQSKATVPKNASTAASLSRRQLVDRGNEYGRNGDWQKAFECFRQVVTSGNSTEWEWSLATGSALGAGDTNACEQLCIKVMEAYGKSNNPDVAERCAKQCLALPNCSEELLEQAAERADFALNKDKNNRWRQLAKAMADYRRENWSSALDWLRQPEESSGLECSLLAWCFGAMARHQLGDTAGARKALEQVDRRVKVLAWTGDLGGQYTWDNYARALAVRNEAEQLILGKTVSQPLNPAEVVANRQKWQSVTFSLNAAERMATQSQWVPAADYFGKALQDPAFDWNVFEVKEDVLAQKTAIAFLMAGDQTRYCDLVRALLAHKVENLSLTVQRRYGFIFLSNIEILPAELKTQALAYARRVCESPDADIEPIFRLLRGQLEYREGHFDSAVETLGQVFFPPATSDGAARAMVFKAMALKRLGRTKEAVEAAQEANDLFAKQTSRGGLYQIHMKELLALLANTGEPTNK